jgi:acyl carrier protein
VTATAGSLEAELRNLFAAGLHIDVPAPNTDLLMTGRLDSVGMVELLLQLERRFGLRVGMEDLDLEHFRSLASIAEFIRNRRDDGGL